MSKEKNIQPSEKKTKSYNFTGKSKIFYIISAVLVALSVLVSFLGVDIAIEFRGGTMITYSFVGDIDSGEAQAKVEEIAASKVNIQQGDLFQSDRKKLAISFVSSEGFTAEKQTALTSALQEIYADNDIEILDSTDVAASSGCVFSRYTYSLYRIQIQENKRMVIRCMCRYSSPSRYCCNIRCVCNHRFPDQLKLYRRCSYNSRMLNQQHNCCL